MKVIKKIADFIVDKRYLVLLTFFILSVVSIFLSSQVKINYDIAEYLPQDSETRIGMDIMETKLEEIKSSSFNLMFKGLKKEEKENIYKELSNIKGVDSIDYENNKNYNKGNYTLYVINVNDTDDSDLAASVFNKVQEKYEDYEIYTSGDIASSNETVLPTWIVVMAVGCALIILIIMCSSYVEPFLFLTSILIAVLLNDGTNIIFKNVSNITSSISAILQMALSMDYSIMLINRYNQEKEKEKDNEKAMKKALAKSFTSISSSSITTIVGLLALVFMSFTIGRDLGFVLAKGVFFSLLSIFTCLPAFILIFDKLITKTKKKSPNIKLDFLGKFSYKIRYISIFLFIGAFIFSFLTKGNLKILYTEDEENKIKDIFKANNQMAIVYKNSDEDKIKKYCKSLEKKEGVDTALCYSNTINEKLKYNEFNKRLNDLGSEMSVDDYLLKIIFYQYYNQSEKNKMTFNEFITFVQNEVYKNEEMSSKLDDNMKENIDRLANFTDINSINQKKNINELSNILEIDKNSTEDILVYYGSFHVNNKINLSGFVNFMNNSVLTNNKYSKNIDNNTRNSIKTLTTFTNINTIRTSLTSVEQARLFGMDENTASQLYLYYITQNEVNINITLSEFANFVSNYILTNPVYQNIIDEDAKSKMNILKEFSDKNIITQNMNSASLAKLLGMDENLIKQLLYLKYSTTDNNTKMTLANFISTIIYIKNTTNYLDDTDISSLVALTSNSAIMNNQTEYTASEVASILNITSSDVFKLYALIDLVNGNTNSWVMNPYDFVNFVLTQKDNLNLDSGVVANLTLLSNVMASSLNNNTYTYQELSSFIGKDEEIVKNIYSLYVANHYTLKLTPQEFVSFILNHRKDSTLSNQLQQSTISQLQQLNNIMNGRINDIYYNVSDLANLLGMPKSSLELIYSLYAYQNNGVSISLKEITEFLLNEVITNKEYASNFDSEKRTKLNTINGIMNASIEGTKYTKNEMFGILSKLTDDLDKKMLDLLYIYYGSEKEYKKSWTLTVEEFVNYLNDTILKDERFHDFIDKDMKKNITSSRKDINDAKKILVGNGYSRMVLNTSFDLESDAIFDFIKNVKKSLGKDLEDFYIVGNSAMAYEMSQTFNSELNFITMLTMIFIFVVVAITFKSVIIPILLVLLIQCAVYMTMGILSFTGGTVYFIALLIVQSILMGATIDYAILYTSYYIEHRKTMKMKEAIINSYNKSIHTILTSSSILIIMTLVVGCFASAIAAKICKTLSQGTLCSALLILILLPSVLAMCDKLIIKKEKKQINNGKSR